MTAEGVMKMMFWAKVKLIAAAVAAVTVVGAGGGVVAIKLAAGEPAGPPAAAQPPADEKPTEMGKLAAQMKPGEWRELKTEGWTQDLIEAVYTPRIDPASESGGGTILNYAHKAAWDPKTRQLLFVGIGHYRALKFISYSAETNSWKLMPVPPWADPRVTKVRWPPGHAYDVNAIDATRGLFFFHWGHCYDIAKEEWTTIPRPPGQNPHVSGDSVDAFPELGGLVCFDSRWTMNETSVSLLDPARKQWKSLGKIPAEAKYVDQSLTAARYNPVHKVMLLGGGTQKGNPETLLFKLDAASKITALKKQPINTLRFDGSGEWLTYDPVSGDYLLIKSAEKDVKAEFWAFNVVKDEWKELPVKPPLDKKVYGCIAPVSNYGVVMWAMGTWAPQKVWLYKHDSPWKETAK